MDKPSNRIRETRLEKKISGTKMAKELGISPQYFYDLEKGERNLSTDLAAKIADILDVSVDYLIGKTLSNENLIDDFEEFMRLKNDILSSLKTITDDEGYFFEDVREDIFKCIEPALFNYFSREDYGIIKYGYGDFKDYFDNQNEYTGWRVKEFIDEFNSVFNYNTFKEIIDYLGEDEKKSLLNSIKNILRDNGLLKIEKTPSVEKEFSGKLELSDEDLLEQFDFELDGEKLTEEETKGVIAYLRTLRGIGKQ